MKFITVTSIGNLRNSYWSGTAWYKVSTYFEESEKQKVGLPSKDVTRIMPFDAWTADFKWVDDPAKKWWQFWKDPVLQPMKKKHYVGTQVEVRVADKHVVYCVSEQYDAVKEMLEA